MSLIKSPCKDCPDRRVLCHSECEKYIAYRKRLDELNEKLARESWLDSYDDIVHRRIAKRQRWK